MHRDNHNHNPIYRRTTAHNSIGDNIRDNNNDGDHTNNANNLVRANIANRLGGGSRVTRGRRW